MILKEFQTYVRNGEGSFVTATIQAIGRCAATMPTLTEQCLRGLMVLMSNANEDVVAESVVVMRNLLQARFLPTAGTAYSTLAYP
jgi:AP-3 complex subunit beta